MKIFNKILIVFIAAVLIFSNINFNFKNTMSTVLAVTNKEYYTTSIVEINGTCELPHEGGTDWYDSTGGYDGRHYYSTKPYKFNCSVDTRYLNYSSDTGYLFGQYLYTFYAPWISSHWGVNCNIYAIYYVSFDDGSEIKFNGCNLHSYIYQQSNTCCYDDLMRQYIGKNKTIKNINVSIGCTIDVTAWNYNTKNAYISTESAETNKYNLQTKYLSHTDEDYGYEYVGSINNKDNANELSHKITFENGYDYKFSISICKSWRTGSYDYPTIGSYTDFLAIKRYFYWDIDKDFHIDNEGLYTCDLNEYRSYVDGYTKCNYTGGYYNGEWGYTNKNKYIDADNVNKQLSYPSDYYFVYGDTEALLIFRKKKNTAPTISIVQPAQNDIFQSMGVISL